MRWQHGERDDMRKRLRKLEVDSGFQDEKDGAGGESEEEDDDEEDDIEVDVAENAEAGVGEVAARA